MRTFLFLDDSPDRHSMFDQYTSGIANVTHVWTAKEAIEQLNATRFEVVWLDHDLDDTDPQETGYVVALYIANHLDRQFLPVSVVIHSWNPEGADRMAECLSAAGIEVKKVPFKVNGPPQFKL